MTTLEISLFGSPKVIWDGRVLSIPRRQVRALLYRLATRLEPIPREQLCFQLWPDVSEAKTRRNLSHLLTHIRRVLPNHAILFTENDSIGLDRMLAWSDTVAFSQLKTSAASRLKPEDVQQIVDLYRGPFLAGFSLPSSVEFEAWITKEQQGWERLYLESLHALIRRWAAQGAYKRAIRCAERYLATDSLAEEVHNHLIALYAVSGNRMAAVRQFEQCALTLEREFGARPRPDTRITYETILKGGIPTDLATYTHKLTLLPSLHVPLIGRQAALDQLEEGYMRAQSGRGAVLLVSGEPGMGKSRLLQEFIEQLPARGTVLVGAGHPGGQNLALKPLVQALSPLVNHVFATFDGNPIRLGEALRLWPELRRLFSDFPQLGSEKPQETELSLFEVLRQLVLQICQRSTCLTLCLDDLHWMDRQTHDWLLYLGQRLRGARLLVLGSYRSDEAETVLDLRHGLARLGLITDVPLPPLGRTAVEQLLSNLTDSACEQAAVTGLHQLTGGNPFFLLQTIQALLETGCSLTHLPPFEEIPVSEQMRTAVAARLAQLSPMTRQILEACAVLPPPFKFEQVHLVSGGSEMKTMDSLDTLVTRHFLGQTDLHYCFRNDLLQRLVLESLNPVRHQLLCRRAERDGLAGAVN